VLRCSVPLLAPESMWSPSCKEKTTA
jgi:hypothetical protein